MLNSAVVRIVDFCAHRRGLVLTVGFFLTIAAASYDVTRFSITTDTQNLISQDLPWRQRQAAFATVFPQKDISVVVTAPTPENAEQATDTLQRDLSKHSSLFRALVQPDSGDQAIDRRIVEGSTAHWRTRGRSKPAWGDEGAFVRRRRRARRGDQARPACLASFACRQDLERCVCR